MIRISTEICGEKVFEELNTHTDLFGDDGIKPVFKYRPDMCGIHIKVKNGDAVIEYSKKVFAIRALGLIYEQGNADFEIIEESRFDSNGIMMDCSRNGVLTVAAVKKLIRKMALMGLDTLMLYTEDTYEIKEDPYFGYMRGRYSSDELKDIVGYAEMFGVELVPCIQTLAHLEVVLKWYPYADIKDTDDILLAEDEKTYAFIERMIKSCRDNFTGNRIHIGMDEAHMLGHGKYFDICGANNGFEVMCRHLERVIKICKKYGFDPMIWSDMFFKYANGGDYHGKNPIDDQLAKIIPTDVSLVYWDYYRDDKNEYDRMIKNHLKTERHTVFAGGAWKFRGYVPSLKISMERTAKAYNACFENGVKDVFITAWGDNGSEASQFSILPVLQLQAELEFRSDVNEEYLAKRLKTCTGALMDDFLKLDMPELEHDKNDGIINPHRYMLFQDVLMGIYDPHVKAGADEECNMISKSLYSIAEEGGEYGYIFDTAAALYGILALKSELGIKLKKAYDNGDKEFIQKTAENTLPELICRTETFRDALEKQWMMENKPFGFEVQDMRLGALIRRFKTTKQRLIAYLDGDIGDIPELQEKRLPLAEVETGEPIRCDLWSRIVTASWI